MVSQDRRLQENRYRQEDWSDQRRDRFRREEDRNAADRRYRSERPEFQEELNNFGRGRELTFQEDFARNGDYLGRYPGDVSGRNHFDEEYFIDDSQFIGRDHPVAPLQDQAFRPAYGRARIDDRDRGAIIENRFARGAFNREASYRSAENYTGLGPKNYRRSDARILEDIGDRLTDDPYVDASDIEIVVQNNEVTLSGIVGNKTQRRRAELIAESVSGVQHLQNNLRLRSHHKAQMPGNEELA
ncbi:BON domain-containing protein [Beijerinckia mobilis]|uniref:BON domain-containing protein n=1 Tax=Beijerinckia mobilis TaxID=231434 RepID=UPI00068FBB98|nr:BON domain-containing protein [Beijerinckia mobilis]